MSHLHCCRRSLVTGVLGYLIFQEGSISSQCPGYCGGRQWNLPCTPKCTGGLYSVEWYENQIPGRRWVPGCAYAHICTCRPHAAYWWCVHVFWLLLCSHGEGESMAIQVFTNQVSYYSLAVCRQPPPTLPLDHWQELAMNLIWHCTCDSTLFAGV